MEKQVVTKVEQQKRIGRFNIYIKNEYAFAVAETVLIKYNIFKGRELTPTLINEIKIADQHARALQLAYNFLSQQLRSAYEIEQKLRTAEIDDSTIEVIMQRLRAEHLVDDLSYAQSLVRTLGKTSLKGPRVIEQVLWQKHIAEQISKIAILEYGEEMQIENATKLYFQLMKRYQRLANFAKKQRVYQAMMQKGYTQKIITIVVDSNVIPIDDEQELINLNKWAEKIWQRNRNLTLEKRILKTKQSLYMKGFQGDDIQRVVDDLSSFEIEN